jgi:hypothetical protein
MTLGEVIRDTARTAGAVVTGMSRRAGIRKVTTTNHSFRIWVGERANSSMNEWDLIEHAIEKESIRLDVVGVDVRFHSSTLAHWEADRKKLPATRPFDRFYTLQYQDVWQANLVLNYPPNSWASDDVARRLPPLDAKRVSMTRQIAILSLNRKEFTISALATVPRSDRRVRHYEVLKLDRPIWPVRDPRCTAGHSAPL